MNDLSTKIAAASTEVKAREEELHKLQAQYDEIERQRFPLKHEEEGYIDRINQANKKNQDQLAAIALLQAQIRKYLRTAPKYTKKKKGKEKGKGKGKAKAEAKPKEEGEANEAPPAEDGAAQENPDAKPKGKGKKGKGKGKGKAEATEEAPPQETQEPPAENA